MLEDSNRNGDLDERGKRPGSEELSAPKRARAGKTNLYKPPTNEELTTLKEVNDLHKSGLLKLQVDELRSEVEVKEKTKKALLPVLQSLEEKLRSIPALTIPEASSPSAWSLGDVALPLKWNKTQIKGKLEFTKPAEVKVVGSYLLGTCSNTDLVVDMAVQIPLECLQPKDYLNFRYHHKRALYCAYLVRHLRCEDAVSDVSYSTLDGDHMMPVIHLKLTVKNVVVRLIPCLPKDGFKEMRFAPSKSNVRKQWYSKACAEETHPPTPHYNSCILRDMSYDRHLHYLYNASHDFLALRDSILLLKVWLHQRELDKGCGGFSGFLASMLVAHLLDTGKINRMMTGYQILRNALHFVDTTDWSSRGISMCRGALNQDAPSLEEFHAHFPVVFVDRSGHLNLCANMTLTSYEHLKYESRLTLSFLDDRVIDTFHCVFMTPVPFLRKFDHFVTISNIRQLRSAVTRFGLQDEAMDWAGNYAAVALGRLTEILKKALGERIQLIAATFHNTAQWPVSTAPSKIEDQEPLTFGLLLNDSLASSVLDKGPIANTPEAKEFSQFWGSKSELRRFQDGSICEAVVWPGSTVAEKRLVCGHIARHILDLHAGIKPETVHYGGGQLDPILHQPLAAGSREEKGERSSGTRMGEEEHALISVAFDRLSQHLRGLKDLPLSIDSIQGTSPAFRHAEVHPQPAGLPPDRIRPFKNASHVCLPSPDKMCPAWVPTLKVVCHLESSGRWPDDLEAIHHIKAAFHLKMAELLRKECGLVTTATASDVFVVLDGFVFQVCVAHRREIGLLKQTFTKEGLSMLRDNPRSMALERETERLPRLTSLLNGVHQHHNAYGPTVRLAKRWVSAHLLTGDHVTPESVELMVAHLFLHPAPFTPPACPQMGFLHFLDLVCNHDWQNTPLIINFNNELSGSECDEIREYFTAHRSQLPIMFIATPTDKQSSLWTKDKPTSVIFKRIVALAKESTNVLHQQLFGQLSASRDFKQIFRPPLDSYDVIIHLRGKLVPRRHQTMDADGDPARGRSSTLKPSLDAKRIPVVNFDPVQRYLQELKEAFDELALFFHDTYGGALIAVLWKRPAFQPQPFKSLQVQAMMPTSSASSSQTGTVSPNVEAVLQDFSTMGRGLVASIEARTDNWKV